MSLRPGGTVFALGALCPGSTSANPIGSWGPLPRISNMASLPPIRPISGYFRALGVDRQGHTLVLADGNARFGEGTLEAVWVDHSGKIRTP